MAVVLDGLALRIVPAGPGNLWFSVTCLMFCFLPSRVGISAVPCAAYLAFGFADLQSLVSILLSLSTSCCPGCLPCTTPHIFAPLVVTALANLHKMPVKKLFAYCLRCGYATLAWLYMGSRQDSINSVHHC